MAPVAIRHIAIEEMRLCWSPIVVMQAAQDGDGHDGSRRCVRCPGLIHHVGDGLTDPLMRPHRISIKGGAVGPQHATQLVLVQDEEVVEALSPHAAQEACADGVRGRCPDRRPHARDAAPRRDAGERRAERAIVVANQEARRHAEGCHLAQLLGDPGVSRVPRDTDVDMWWLKSASRRAVATT